MKLTNYFFFFVLVIIFFLLSCAGPQSVPSIQKIDINVSEGTQLAFDISPDGRTIVFDLLGQLWLLPAEGGMASPITDAARDNAEDLDPSFSPDGKWIVFQSNRSRNAGLWLMSSSGGQARYLTHADPYWDKASPEWSPDSRQIAFVRSNTTHIVDIETSEVKKLKIEGLPSPAMRDPSWSPDGSHIVFVNEGRFASAGGRIWEADTDGRNAVPLTPENVKGLGPVYSPDGGRIAFFSHDQQGQFQLWVKERSSEVSQKLTDHSDTTPLRARWSCDGNAIYYSADGRLWRIASKGGEPEEIPFNAKLQIMRKRARLKPVHFNPPDIDRPARGHMGLALSPDGKRIAVIALGKIWIFEVGGEPSAIAPMPSDADGLSWSPNGKEVAWSAGSQGTEDLFATDVRTGKIRRLTALPGREIRPSWSPDGRYIAFLHTDPGFTTFHVRVIHEQSQSLETLDSTIDLGEADWSWRFLFSPLGQEVPQWSPDSRGLLLFDKKARIVQVSGKSTQLDRFPTSASFVKWLADGSTIYVCNDMLWRTSFSSESGMVGEPTPISEDPALYPSVARDGSILYVSKDGLRLRRPDGLVECLGWPLRYSIPGAPERLLIRNVRIIDGRETSPSAPSDILIEGGRIVSITSAKALKVSGVTNMIEAQGRMVIPGLIDAHMHLWDDKQLPGLIYYGVTTVRDVGSAIARTAGFRDAIEAGVRVGPRIICSGFQFNGGEGLSGQFSQEPTDKKGRVRYIELARAFGANNIKMFGLDWDAAADIIELAHTYGMPVSGHVAHSLPLFVAGIDGKEHVGRAGGYGRWDHILYDDIIQLFKAAQIWVVPTITAFSSAVRLFDDPGILDRPDTASFLSPFLRFWAKNFPSPQPTPARRASWERVAQIMQLVAGKLHHAGIKIATGTDTPHLPWGIHWEMEGLVKAGLSPLEAITAATKIAAHVLGAEEEIGTIADGKWADFVILDADPLEDIRNTRKIWMVIQGGKVVDRQELLLSIERETTLLEGIK